MPFSFSKKLRDDLIDYFARVYGVAISNSQADEFLDSMACLYSQFKERNAKESFAPIRGRKDSLRSSLT